MDGKTDDWTKTEEDVESEWKKTARCTIWMKGIITMQLKAQQIDTSGFVADSFFSICSRSIF